MGVQVMVRRILDVFLDRTLLRIGATERRHRQIIVGVRVKSEGGASG